jgi:hypothetical protein
MGSPMGWPKRCSFVTRYYKMRVVASTNLDRAALQCPPTDFIVLDVTLWTWLDQWATTVDTFDQ